MHIDTDARNILVTHQFVTGSSRTESEDISVGGSDNVDASRFLKTLIMWHLDIFTVRKAVEVSI